MCICMCAHTCVPVQACSCVHNCEWVSIALKRMIAFGRKREDPKMSMISLFVSAKQSIELGDSARPQGVSLPDFFQKVIGKGSPSKRDKWLLKVNSE